jgi:hypothetical protein
LISQITKLLQPLSYQQMCKSLPENGNRAPSEPFKNMTGAFTWERRYFGQSFGDGNDLLRNSTDILIWDLGNAIFGKSFKESLEGCNINVAYGEHLIKCNLDMSHHLVRRDPTHRTPRRFYQRVGHHRRSSLGT